MKLVEVEVTETRIGTFFYEVTDEEYERLKDDKNILNAIEDNKRLDELCNEKSKEALDDWDAYYEGKLEVVSM